MNFVMMFIAIGIDIGGLVKGILVLMKMQVPYPKKTVDQRPNVWPPSSLSVDLSNDDEDCHVLFEPFSQQQFTPIRVTEGYCKQVIQYVMETFQV